MGPECTVSDGIALAGAQLRLLLKAKACRRCLFTLYLLLKLHLFTYQCLRNPTLGMLFSIINAIICVCVLLFFSRKLNYTRCSSPSGDLGLHIFPLCCWQARRSRARRGCLCINTWLRHGETQAQCDTPLSGASRITSSRPAWGTWQDPVSEFKVEGYSSRLG